MSSVIAITLTSREDAEAVRDALLKLSEKYDYVSMGDYLELVGASSTFADDKVGWTDLKDIEIKQVGKDEFLLDLPEPKPLENRKAEDIRQYATREDLIGMVKRRKDAGYTNTAIAQELKLAESTVRSLLNNPS